MNNGIPDYLNGNKASGSPEQEDTSRTVLQFEIGAFKNFIYLILDWKTRKAALIDPQEDLSVPLQTLQKFNFELTHIFLTHTHFDHIAGVPELASKYPLVPILVHEGDSARLKPILKGSPKIRSIHDGEVIAIGNLAVKVIHTPGHSPGECCYLLLTKPPFLFTGDTVFIRDCGRTDLAGGSTKEMFESLQKLKKLSPEAIVLPGHHYVSECASTLLLETQKSPPFQCTSIAELEALP